MLKKRVIAVLTVKDNLVVQSKRFRSYLPIGRPEIAVAFLNQWGIDEIVYNDISATIQNKGPNIELINKLSRKCLVPLAVGGGIKSVEHVHALMKNGADKVIVNNLLLTSPSVVKEIAREFGSQSVIGSLDLKANLRGDFQPFNYLLKNTPEELMAIPTQDWAQEVVGYGVGELLVNFVDRDGMYNGYQIDILRQLQNDVPVPIIALGGAKNAHSLIELFQKTSIPAAAAGNFFHFTEHSVNITKMQIRHAELPVRLETHANYADNEMDGSGRLRKKDDDVLENMLFKKIVREVI